MNLPKNILPLTDGDWICYMACSAVEYPLMQQWKEMRDKYIELGLVPPPEPTPSFESIIDVFENRIKEIKRVLKTTTRPILFFTGPNNFRKEVAVTKTYKGNRDSTKPFFYNDLKAYIEARYDCREEDNLEADDLMAIYQTEAERTNKFSVLPIVTCIVTVDKDLRQVEGWHYSPEGHNYGSFGPTYVTYENCYIKLKDPEAKQKKILGTGWKFFYAQLITGDTVDNIPGLPLGGAVLAMKLLADTTTEAEAYEAVREAYRDKCLMADDYLLEQAYLLWMVRSYEEDDKPTMWSIPVASADEVPVSMDEGGVDEDCTGRET